ncbi:MAG: DUF3857 domain-containing protein [Bacteroidetes bacterium]|nr:DUF3857 domain-containing protein [Bacteroidota bacterium]
MLYKTVSFTQFFHYIYGIIQLVKNRPFDHLFRPHVLKPFLWLNFFFIISTCLNAQINSTIPQWVNINSIKDVGIVNKKAIKDGYHYVLVDEQYNIVKKHNYFHYATSAITEEALVNVSQIEFSYDPSYEKAYLHSVKIHRGNQVIDKTPSLVLKELNEENERGNGILNGKKTLYTNLSDVRKNDIVEYSFSIIGENPIMKNYFNLSLWLSYSVPVGKIYLRVIFPKNIEPSISNQNISISPKIKITDVNDYTWEVNNPKITKLESSTPSWYNPYRRVQISNLKNWNEVKEHCRSLLAVSAYNNLGLKKIVDSIAKSTKNIEEKITSIIEFVQTHVRYSGNEAGIYSHVPRSPEYILKNRFGDCKEKSTLLNEMLKLIEVKAYPVLINTSLGKTLTDQNPSIDVFNHCISCFIYEEKYYFVDPTISYQRGNFKLRIVPSYEIGMVLDNSKNTFETIEPDLKSTTSMLEEFFIEKTGGARLKVTSVFTGSSADASRYDFLVNSLYDVQDAYKKFYTRFTDDIEIIDTVSYIDNEEKNEFTVTEHYFLNNFWVPEDSTKSKVVKKDFLPYSLHYKLNYGEENKRNDPLLISYPVNHTHTITIYKEGGWNVENSTKTENNRFFSYSYSTKLNEESLILAYSFSSKTDIIEPKDYLDYKTKMDFINNNMVFSSEEKPLTDGTVGFNWSLILVLLCGLTLASIASWHLYKKPFKSDYISRFSSIGGWLILVGIGVTITPFTLLFSLYKECEGDIAVNYAIYYFDERSVYFSPLRGYFSLFVTFFNSLLFVTSILILILFYQKKASFRLYYSLFRISNVVILIIDVIILHSLYSDSNELDERQLLSTETTGMIRVFIQTCIWVPYIWYSERSRYTFTKENTLANGSPTEIPPPLEEDNANIKLAD